MKKLCMILIASVWLAACGGGHREHETNSPEVTPQDNSREGMDTTSTDMQGDTTKSGGTTGSASGSELNGSEDESADVSGGSAALP